MTITQTVDIPVDRRLLLDLPVTLPVGRAKITITPEVLSPGEALLKKAAEMTTAETIAQINRQAEELNKEAMDVLSYQWPGFNEEKLREMERVNRYAAELNRENNK